MSIGSVIFLVTSTAMVYDLANGKKPELIIITSNYRKNPEFSRTPRGYAYLHVEGAYLVGNTNKYGDMYSVCSNQDKPISSLNIHPRIISALHIG